MLPHKIETAELKFALLYVQHIMRVFLKINAYE